MRPPSPSSTPSVFQFRGFAARSSRCGRSSGARWAPTSASPPTTSRPPSPRGSSSTSTVRATVDEVSCAFSFVCFFDTKEREEGEAAAACAMRPCAPINFEIGLATPPPLRDDKEPRARSARAGNKFFPPPLTARGASFATSPAPASLSLLFPFPLSYPSLIITPISLLASYIHRYAPF